MNTTSGPDASTSLEGKKLGPYRLQTLLGVGGLGRGSLGRRGTPADPRPVLICAATILAAGAAFTHLGPWQGAVVLLACAATWRLTPIVIQVATRFDVAVLPGGRAVNSRATPLLGGVAVLIPVLLAAGAETPHATGLLVGVSLMLLAGVLDDVRGVTPLPKLLLQAAAAGALYLDGLRIEHITCAPMDLAVPLPLQLPLLLFWVVLVTNAVNLIDGIDGLASSLGVVACAGYLLAGGPGSLALVLAGALLGFLRHNLPQARVFLGDTGSLPLGFLLAAMTVSIPGGFDVTWVAAILAIPLGDMAFCALRRTLRGKPIFRADKGHLHHRFLRAYRCPGWTLLLLSTFASVHLAIASSRADLVGLIAMAVAWIGFGLYLFLLRGVHSGLHEVFRQRRTFKRLHILRDYAAASLQIARNRDDVRPILRRVVEDLGLASLRLGDIHAEGSAAGEPHLAFESLDCGALQASWTYPEAKAPGLVDEQRAVLDDILRAAAAALAWESGVAGSRALPRAHLLASHRADLLCLGEIATELKEQRLVHPVLVYTGRRDALELDDLPASQRCAATPDIELDVDTGSHEKSEELARHRYEQLLDVAVPAFVVVLGDNAMVRACASAARHRNIHTVHLDRDPQALSEALADLRPRGPAHAARAAHADPEILVTGR